MTTLMKSEWIDMINRAKEYCETGGRLREFLAKNNLGTSHFYRKRQELGIPFPKLRGGPSKNISLRAKRSGEFIPTRADNGEISIRLTTGEILTVRGQDGLKTVLKTLKEI